MCKKICVAILLMLFFLLLFGNYKVPNDDIVDVYDMYDYSYMVFFDFNDVALEYDRIGNVNLEELIDDNIELAGIKFSKKLNAEKKFNQRNLINTVEIGKNFPKSAINIERYETVRNVYSNYDMSRAVVTYDTDNGVGVFSIDYKTGKTTDYPGIKISEIPTDRTPIFFQDQNKVILQIIPQDRGEIPYVSSVPTTPKIEETYGKEVKNRTYTKLLKNKSDEILFDYYATNQIVILDLDSGDIKNVGEPDVHYYTSLSPDNKYLLVSTIHKPYSYEVPYYRFPKRTQVWDLEGNLVKEIIDEGLTDAIPTDGVVNHVRRIHWFSDAGHKLQYTLALDEGNPKNKVEYRDAIYLSDYPYENRELLFKTNFRYSSSTMISDNENLIYSEYEASKKLYRSWLYNINSKKKKLISERNSQDSYSYLGYCVSSNDKRGNNFIYRKGDLIYYINNQGASKDGLRPYLATYNLKSGEYKKIFETNTNNYESIKSIVDKDVTKIVISSTNPETPVNYYVVELESGARTQITHNKNPYPEYARLKKEIVRYKRKDGVDLCGILYLPANYKGKEKLPLVIHAYPYEFTNPETAGQITLTDKTFSEYWGTDVRYFAMRGYAVLQNASVPIIGDTKTANDTFIPQLLSSVEAAIDYLDDRDIINPKKVGILGHSYGAFMVANVLANSELCQAGIARSGAYNRTLTPFGFQHEKRTLWQAKDTYLRMSPFMYADKINEPLLMIHGQADTNSGTYTIQSERMYSAIKGNGGNAKLVLLPYEGHSYKARESRLHVIEESLEWFDKYLK